MVPESDNHPSDIATAYGSLSRAEEKSICDHMRAETEKKVKEEPILGSYFHATILNHNSFRGALSFRLASKLDNPMLPTMLIRDVIEEAIGDDASSAEESEQPTNATSSITDKPTPDRNQAFPFINDISSPPSD